MFHLVTLWLSEILSLTPETHLYEAVIFFVEDILKIFSLLFIMMGIMTFLRLHLPIEKMKRFMTHTPFGVTHFMAAILGAVTPFCSCSSLPLFFTFLRSGISLGATFSFLATSPLVNEVALVLLWGIFGTKFMLFWLISAITLGTVIGMVFELLHLERFITPDFSASANTSHQEIQKGLFAKIRYSIEQSFHLTRKVALFIIVGIGIGAVIHGFVPQEFFLEKMSITSPLAIPITVLLAVPFYSNASGIIPVIQSLIVKGVPLGTALAFMMAIVGLSLPEAMILKKAMQWKLLALFFGSVAIAIMIIGFLGNRIF
ncbi:permease [Candidatus Gracilibacteria bacterium]|nr:permease [Candidatus Gracilibacteria bacterium]